VQPDGRMQTDGVFTLNVGRCSYARINTGAGTDTGLEASQVPGEGALIFVGGARETADFVG
jgi:hypothetical protein